MSCCGARRNPVAPSLSGPAGAASQDAQTPIRYLGTGEILIAGPTTGRRYRFSPEAPLQAVSLRDRDALLASRLFARA